MAWRDWRRSDKSWLSIWAIISSRRERLVSAARKRSSASWRRLCSPEIPAASSRIRRRLDGLAAINSLICPWRTRAGEFAPVLASANKSCTSLARTVLPLTLYLDPLPFSMIRVTSSVSSSLNIGGAIRAELSMVRITWAWLRPGRCFVPENITSSMALPRMALAELAPMTQRMASRRLDLPHPLGPTTPVRPG